MAQYIIFNDTSGIINRVISVDATDIDLNVDANEDYLQSAEIIDFNVHYIANPPTAPEVEVMPYLSSIASWDKAGVDATGSDTATLSGLPNPSVVTIDPLDATVAYLEDHDVTDGTAAFTTTVEGVFKVTAKSEGYLDYIEHISSGNTIGISLLSVFSDFDSVNVFEEVGVDLSTVSTTMNDVNISTPDVIGIELSTVSVTENDATIYAVEIINIDLSRINVTNRYPSVYESTIINTDLLTVSATALDATDQTTVRIEIDTNSVQVNMNTVDVYPELILVDTATTYVTLKDTTI